MSRFAVQTVAWGSNVDLETMIREVKAAGYEGIELFQHPDDLGGMQALVDCCREAEIHVVGISADSFDGRCKWVRKYDTPR